MSKSILYYPTIEFGMHDYEWLWQASLLWDKIYRIVPDGYTLNEPDNIVKLCSTGEIGIALSPNRYSNAASDRFINNIENRSWVAAALEFHNTDVEKYTEYTRLNKYKVDEVLKNVMLLYAKISEDFDWLYVPKELANQYIIFLATEIAIQNNLSLNTYDSNAWTAATFFLNDGNVQPHCLFGENYVEDAQSNLAIMSVCANEIFPENLLSITPERILQFRKKRKDERQQFHDAYDDFCNQLSMAGDPKILEQIYNDEKIKIEKATIEYRKSMDILNVTKFTGFISSGITIASNAIGYFSGIGGIEGSILKVLSSVGIGLSLLTRLIQKKAQKKVLPYSYLSQIKSLNTTDFGKFSIDLYRKMEEFIND